MIVADTDVLIDALRGREPWMERVAVELESGALATTAITEFELMSGCRSTGEERKVRQLLGAMIVLGFDAPAAAASAGVRRALERTGASVGMADYMIAGICLAGGHRLLTRNRRHFDRIPGLQLG